MTSHGRFVALEVLKLKPGSKASTYTQLYVAFTLSGAIHFWADFIPLGRWNAETMKFFILQAIGIHCEDIFIAWGARAGLRPSRLWRFLGYILVWQWFAWCLPNWLDTLIKARVFGAGPRIPIIQTVVSSARRTFDFTQSLLFCISHFSCRVSHNRAISNDFRRVYHLSISSPWISILIIYVLTSFCNLTNV